MATCGTRSLRCTTLSTGRRRTKGREWHWREGSFGDFVDGDIDEQGKERESALARIKREEEEAKNRILAMLRNAEPENDNSRLCCRNTEDEEEKDDIEEVLEED